MLTWLNRGALGGNCVLWRVIACCAAIAVSGCGFFDDGLTDYERQQLAIKQAAEKLAGKAERKTYQLGEGWAVNLSGEKITDATFEAMKNLGKIAELNLSQSDVTDAQLKQLPECGAAVVFRLNLSNTGITDAGLESLSNLGLLMELNLKGTKVTAGAVSSFKTKRKTNPNVLEFAKNTKVEL